jgi:hypothetical protein
MITLSCNGFNFEIPHFVNFMSSIPIIRANYRFLKFKKYIFYFLHCFNCKFLLGSAS